MNPEAASTAAQALSWDDMTKQAVQDLLTRLQAGADWATMQIPDVLQQYILFHAIFSGAMLVLSLILVALAAGWSLPRIRASMQAVRDAPGSNNDSLITACIGNVLAFIALVCAAAAIFGCNIKLFILAVFAPKVLILEQLILVAGGRSIL